MDNIENNSKKVIGNISISEEVIVSIAKKAALEIDGVSDVSTGNIGIKGLLTQSNYLKPIRISLNDGIAKIQISIIVDPIKRIPDLANSVQQNIKKTVQSMTGLAVSGVDVVISGITRAKKAPTTD